MLNWEGQGYSSKIVHDQIKATVDDSNPVELHLTLLTTQQLLEGY